MLDWGRADILVSHVWGHCLVRLGWVPNLLTILLIELTWGGQYMNQHQKPRSGKKHQVPEVCERQQSKALEKLPQGLGAPKPAKVERSAGLGHTTITWPTPTCSEHRCGTRHSSTNFANQWWQHSDLQWAQAVNDTQCWIVYPGEPKALASM